MTKARRGRSGDDEQPPTSSNQVAHTRNRGTRGEGVRGTLADVAIQGGDPEQRSTEMNQERVERGRGDDRLDENPPRRI